MRYFKFIMVKGNLEKKLRKGVAGLTIASMIGLSGCAGYTIGPQANLRDKSVGLYVSSDQIVTDANVTNEEGLTTGEKVLLGLGAAAIAGALIYNANRGGSSSPAPVKKSNTGGGNTGGGGTTI